MSLGNPMVTRFPNGVTNATENAIFADLTVPDVTKFHTYFNDFDVYTAGDWVVTETQAGATQALTAGDGGLLLLTNSAADDDIIVLQKTPAAFTFTAGKKTFFSARLMVSDATQSDFVVGLQVVDTTPLDVTDGVYFLKSDGRDDRFRDSCGHRHRRREHADGVLVLLRRCRQRDLRARRRGSGLCGRHLGDPAGHDLHGLVRDPERRSGREDHDSRLGVRRERAVI